MRTLTGTQRTLQENLTRISRNFHTSGVLLRSLSTVSDDRTSCPSANQGDQAQPRRSLSSLSCNQMSNPANTIRTSSIFRVVKL